jgi:hypothetical protein
MVKELKIIDEGHRSEKVNVLLRGQSFRSTVEDQTLCLRSIFDNIVDPLIEAGFIVTVIQCTYKNELDDLFQKEQFQRYGNSVGYEYLPFLPEMVRTQEECFLKALGVIEKESTSTLLVRPDLIFIKKINVDRFFDNIFLFQWNYFHDYSIKEMPDQLHFIGSELVGEIRTYLSNDLSKVSILPNGAGQGSLHNMYNFLFECFGSDERISYIYQFNLSEKDFDGSRCKLRGNSLRSECDDHIFEYRRIREPKIDNFHV